MNKGLSNKICLITGSTDGIGKCAAFQLADKGAIVILVGRDYKKTVNVQEEIKAKTGNDSVDFLISDLSSQSSIKNLAREFQKRYKKLHILINNAGTFSHERILTSNGIELIFAVNYLSRFLLTNLLLNVIKKAALPE